MSTSLITFMSASRRFMRSTAAIVLIAFGLMILQPTIAAAQTANTPKATAMPDNSAEAQLSKSLQRIEEQLARAEDKLQKHQDASAERHELKQLQQTLEQLDQTVRQDFNQVEKHIAEKGLATEILERHQAMVAHYQEEYQALIDELYAINSASDDSQLKQHTKAALDRLKAKKNGRSHQPFDPNNQPFRVPDVQLRAPKETKEELEQLLQRDVPVQVAASELLPGMLALAATAGVAPQPSDLASNEDVQITDEIKALAQSLDHDPVAIYNWVRENIEYVPTYGSIQGSQLTLDNQEGNAFDTASLLIALLRASGIPARYAYGTVQIPIDQVMNWVGGVTDPMAALQLLSQGGIPNTGLAQGGVIKYAKIEHIWVEAWVDYFPSRGVKNIQGDSWIPMDASFKQYTYPEKLDLNSTYFDPMKEELDSVLKTIGIGQDNAYIQGINTDLYKTMLQLGEKGLFDYLDEKPDMDNRKIIQLDYYAVLASSLPYHTIAVGGRVASLPESMQHVFTYKLYNSQFDQLSDNYDFVYKIKYSALAGKKLKLSFTPASDTDAQTLSSYISNITPGVEITKEQLPQSIPGYLIYVIPVLTLDGQEVAKGRAVPIGQELASSLVIKRLNGNPHVSVNKFVSGETRVIRLSHGTRPSKHDTIGVVDRNPHNVLYNASTSYFGHLYYATKALDIANNSVSYGHPSVGTIATEVVPQYFFGIPRNVTFGGMQVDMDIVENSVVSKDNNATSTKNAVLSISMMSSLLEGEIPMIFGASDVYTSLPVSAMHVIANAIVSGKKIYTINASNSSNINLLSVSSDVKSDILNAINYGLEVIVPESNSVIGTWVGTGYVLNDPTTGAGTYRISGGLNGGAISETVITEALAVVGLAASLIVNAVIPVANADTSGCETDEEEANNIQFNWQSTLALAVLLGFIWATWEVTVPVMIVFIGLSRANAAGKGCPVYIIGGNWTNKKGEIKPMDEYQAHIASALTRPEMPDELTYAGSQQEKTRSWYRSKDECRDIPDQYQCDEYPFYSTLENQPSLYPERLSLRLIQASHNNTGGQSLRQFYNDCGVPINGRFKVKIGPSTQNISANGELCIRNAVFK